MKKNYLLTTFIWMLAGGMASAQELVHYWNFNKSGNREELLTVTHSSVQGASLVHGIGGTSSVESTGNTGQDFGTLNARMGEDAETHLRFNNPVGASLTFHLPLTGYKNPVVTYVTRRSAQSARAQLIYYSLDGATYNRFDSLVITEQPTLQTFDFSGIAETENNPDFRIRIEFVQVAGNGGGNNRFDNFAVDAVSLSGDVNPPVATFVPGANALNIPVDATLKVAFNEAIRLSGAVEVSNENIATAFELRKNNATGEEVAFSATITGQEVVIEPTGELTHGQIYYLGVKAGMIEDVSGNTLEEAAGIHFTTITVQTVFQPGDLLIVAYRMNNSDRDDEFAFISLKDIQPGTMITFTDAKYTNAGTQCPGGLVWTAPREGVKAGDVVALVNDGPSVSVGTLSGSGFGLSSSGDQIMVYTGSADNPAYITALSANAWVEDKPSCSGGSTSRLPEALEEGLSAISLSAAPGNSDGLSVNAYYAGPQNVANAEELRTAVLNSANWVAQSAGSQAQQWPVYAFLKDAPIVLKAEIADAFTIRVVFDRALDNTSATDITNFTNIEGLESVIRKGNGASDTLLLQYSGAFASGVNYTLRVEGVKDASGNAMEDAYVYSFTYNTAITFEKAFYVVNEGEVSAKIRLKVTNPSVVSFDLVLKENWGTASANDFSFRNRTIELDGRGEDTIEVLVPVSDDAEPENDEYFVLAMENTSGLTVTGADFVTVYIRDNDRKAPEAREELSMNLVTSFDPSAAGSTTEAIAYDAQTKRIFATSAIQNRFDIIDFSVPASPVTIKSVDMSSYGGGITGIAVKNGMVAVGAPASVETDNGSVVFFDTEGTYVTHVTVGALPDMVCFTPDGTKALTANEGQPSGNYAIDPEGSVSVIDVSGGLGSIDQSKVTRLSFEAFNAEEESLVSQGVRKTKANSTLARDLEPEYITVAADSKKAWVTLQENNAIAEIDLERLEVTSVWPLGTKDYSLYGNAADMSNNSGEILIANWPVKGFYIPDAIASYSIAGTTYLVTANEGDEKEYGVLNERTTVANVQLDPERFPNAAMLQQSHAIGNFRITNLHGDTDGDGDYDELYAVGTRSFSIFNAETGELVYDSGDDFDYIIARDPVFGSIFNSDHEANKLKGRSHTKGSEPEAVTVAEINGNVYAFIGLERMGGVMAYNVTDPARPYFVDYKNNRSVTAYAGDHGPEYVVYVSPEDSPDGRHYLLVSNEISGTITVFELNGDVVTSVVAGSEAKASSFVVYPNPAKSILYLSETSSVEIENLSGQQVFKAADVNQIELGNFAKGMYILKTSMGETRKFIVE